ncbi:hypothetical protein [Anaerobacillus sp. 1_MG-2023]|uniref:hypothetical protein n=1 Tax=Anaerobacillus sp. 1_MG-2023 TaxID=3062655 RepID=UPI0026E22862|nr:hypothetical protein [Anaerobacillus sp. 1_MG-2023]MDO6657867.1 hypothetical protein [Anaerobacillus sp. 1_MG-2023]
MNESKLGAPAAFRGYRLQTLYIINRILNAKDKYKYYPEKDEDLSIRDEDESLLEVIQIKAHASSELKLSDFKIGKQDSFFRRISKYKEFEKNPNIKIISFDKVGPELMGAFIKKNKDDQEKIRKKLIKAGYTIDEIGYFFQTISIEIVDEGALKSLIFEKIEEISMACSIGTTFDILNAWLYHCSEFSIEIKLKNFIEKIYSIGDNANAQMQYKQHWGKTVSALNGNKELVNKNAFTEGSFTEFNHIEQNLDIKREKWLKQIYEGHLKDQLVIMHGASGQGKTTLAYRYMKEYFPENFRFELTAKGLSSIETTLEVAHAIKSFAARIPEVPIGLYIDIPPRELNWLDILRELKGFSNIFILVTIREEDWQRSSGDVYELSWKEIELSFSKEEAEKYYEEYVNKLPQQEHLNFKEAWSSFGEKGPLLEFAYYLNQGIRLKEKLSMQIKKLEEECGRTQNYEKLELLKVITISSVYNSRVDLKKIKKCLNLKDITSLKYLENEYFIKIDEEENILEGLHYVRSLIIRDIVIDDIFNPWVDYAKYSLISIVEEDYEAFLKNVYVENRNVKDILTFISNKERFSPTTWVGINGVLSSLLWLGTRDYIEENKTLIDEIGEKFDYASISLFILDFDISNIMKEPSYTMLKNIIDESSLNKIKNYRKRQTPKVNTFKYIKKWLSDINNVINYPQTKNEWLALGNSSLWIGKSEGNGDLRTFIEQINLNKILKLDYKIEEIAKIIAGINEIIPDKIKEFCEKNKEVLLRKFRLQYNILKVEQTSESIKIYKMINLYNEKSVSVLVTNELYILRELFPYKKYYCSQGVGHKFIMDEVRTDLDESFKKISIDNLLLNEYKKLNRVALALLRNQYRVENWNEFLSWHDENFEKITHLTLSLKELLTNYFKKNSLRAFTVSLKKYTDSINELGKISQLLLPSLIIDKFGAIDEYLILKSQDSTMEKLEKTNLLIPTIEKYKKLTKSWEDFRANMEKLAKDIELNISYNYITKKKYTQKFSKENLKKIEASKVGNWLILINIRSALENLCVFSNEYNKVFKGWFKEGIENKLEHQKNLIKELQTILSYYAGIIENQRSSHYNLESAHKRDLDLFLNNLIKEVKGIKEIKEMNYIDVQQDKIEENVLIIHFDINRSIFTIFEVVELIIFKLKGVISDINQRTNLYLDIDKMINKIIILPSYREKYFFTFNWIIPFYALKQETENINQVYLIPKPLDKQQKDHLKINKEINTKLFEKYSEILLIMQHLNAIVNEYSSTDKLTLKIIDKYLNRESYLENVSKSFSELLQELTNITNLLSEKSKLDSHLEIELFEKVRFIKDYLLDHFDGSLQINDESLTNIQRIKEDILLINLISVELFI